MAATHVVPSGYSSLMNARRRASVWERPESAVNMSELGKRVHKTWLASGKSLQEFCAAANLSSKALDTLFRREDGRAGDTESNAAVTSVVKIARAGGVSLVWLAAGDGDILTGAYASGEDAEMGELPEALARATMAAMAITGCTRERAIRAARLAMEQVGPSGSRNVDQWLGAVRTLIDLSSDESGERPSVRAIQL